MSLVLSYSCLCPVHWSQVLSWEWRCSWAVPTGDAPTTYEWSAILLPTEVWLIQYLELPIYFPVAPELTHCCPLLSTACSIMIASVTHIRSCTQMITHIVPMCPSYTMSVSSISNKFGSFITELHPIKFSHQIKICPLSFIYHTQCRHDLTALSHIARFMRPTWGPSGSCCPQMGPMLAPWTLQSGLWRKHSCCEAQPPWFWVCRYISERSLWDCRIMTSKWQSGA